MSGWIVSPPPPYPPCVVLLDPNSDTAKCGAQCVSGRTVLDLPLCDDCWEAIREP